MTLTPVNTQTSSRKHFLLVVDSDPGNLSYTSTLLQKFRYKVWTAGTGAEALEIVDAAMPGLIVTAGRLDDMEGVDFVRKIKRNPDTNAVSVIVLSGKNDLVDPRACLAAGAVTCLGIPVPIEDLYRVVQVAIEPVPRMHLRINTNLPVSIKGVTVSCGEGGCARELSEQGTYIRIAHPFPLKTRLPVQIHLADGPVSAEAEVIYVHKGNQSNPKTGMGLQFVRISRQDQERIRLFIREEITKDVSL